MRLRWLLLSGLCPTTVVAQTPSSAATVSGVVRDSIRGTPLGAATVQIVGADTATHFSASAVSDSAGHFVISGVPDGSYLLGFLHPMLDSIGVAAPLRQLRVADRKSAQIDLAIPGAARLRAAICGAGSMD